MSTDFDGAYYEDLRGRVRGVLIAVAKRFPTREVGLVDELIDANESGIALETLCQMLADEDRGIGSEVVAQIESLARDMGLPDVAEQARSLRPE